MDEAGGTASSLTTAALAKRLASPHLPTRLRAVRALASHLLSSSYAHTAGDLLKLWKGLFYCVWHSDKPAAQSDLTARISSIITTLPPPLAGKFLDAALHTLRREWSGIDFLRLDKFYLLLRRILNSVFTLLNLNSWNPNLTTEFINILLEKSFFANDKHQAKGINYQLSEIYVDELKKFLPLPLGIVITVFNPFFDLLAKTEDKILVCKVKTNVFGKLLNCGSKVLEGKSDEEVKKIAGVGILTGMSKRFFELASSQDTFQGNRKVLFGLHHEFLKLENDLEKSGVEIKLPELENFNGRAQKAGDEDINGEGEIKKPLKKRKKEESSEIGGGLGDKQKKKKKKKKKSPKELDCEEKKDENNKKTKKKNNKQEEPRTEMENVADVERNELELKENDDEKANAFDSFSLDETLMSNLQKQFEKVAAEAGMANGLPGFSDMLATPLSSTIAKKRKRTKGTDRQEKMGSEDVTDGSVVAKSGEKSAKKVRFSMKNNLVWKPSSPLPPQSLRLPPSSTPRGSALKKGVPPGPVREISSPLVMKVKRKSNSARKALKSAKSVSPAVKRLRKLQNSV